ncbi:MAG: HAD-IC family P-type ATPase, partial [Actinomycetota bacterium]|nr:HAD-IC family P-type ATPase [Actinomycetota bacterium]MDQ2846650.1 HAD-IC family P-type ATPase [Actinomycetota bacterium]
DLAVATGFDSAPGRGVSAQVDGQSIRVGSPSLLCGGLVPIHATVAAVEAAGHTAVLVLRDARRAGVLALADQLRPGAARTVAELSTLTGNRPVLLTGDNAGAARHLAAEVGIIDSYSGLLPADKVSHVRRLQQAGRRVLLVGDGVNDAPALAAADLGLAMGRHGSDLALETSDAVIVRDELGTLTKVIDLSRRARRLVTANLIIAGTVITALVSWDLAGHLPLPLGVAGHESSTVIVGLNGLRLLRNSAWHKAGRVAN